MDKQITMDGHIFTLNDDGLYETKDNFILEDIDDFMFSDENEGRILICKDVEGKYYPWLISVEVEHDNHEAYRKFILKRGRQGLFVIVACESDNYTIGGLFID